MGSAPVGEKVNVEPGGAAVPHVTDESIAGRQTWLRLHNRNHNPMNPSCQALFGPRDDDLRHIDKQRQGFLLYRKQAGR